MQINSLQSVASAYQVPRGNNTKGSEPISASPTVHSLGDQLDLSSEAQQLMASGGISSADGELRMDRISSIRQAIAEGTYETSEKMDAALDRFLDKFA